MYYRPEDNPIPWVDAPKRPVVILPTLAREQAHSLIDEVISCRDKAIIALFTKSGLRLQELTNIKLNDIDWDNRTIRVIGKGNKEAHAPFGELSDNVLIHHPSSYLYFWYITKRRLNIW